MSSETADCRLRFIRPVGATFEEMRDNARKSKLYEIGDTILIWVNEGDFWEAGPVDLARQPPTGGEK